MKNNFNEIKKMILIAIFSDDYLVDKLVLKGGNAMELIYKISDRFSLDLDFSMDAKYGIVEDLEYKLRTTLENELKIQGYNLIDWKFKSEPTNTDPITKEFWRGNKVEFKLIELEKYTLYQDSPQQLSTNAISIDDFSRKKIEIDISNFEYCGSKRPEDIDGLTMYVYSPEMIVLEKLRAICQQTNEYNEVIRRAPGRVKSRAKDFYDIYIITQKLQIDLLQPERLNLLSRIFRTKRVKTHLLRTIVNYYDLHNRSFNLLQTTISNTKDLKDFTFYFEYVIELSNSISRELEILGIE
jgi:predicted nucleotidyltransferase component of viral defense system